MNCPKCNAELPPKGQFCLDCGLDLYAEGVHHKPVPWGRIIGIPLVVAAAAAVLIIGPCKAKAPPEATEVTRRTQNLLDLLAKEDYAAAVRRFLKPNAKQYAQAEERLRDIARGTGAPGLNIARSQGFRDLDDARAYVRKHGTPHVEYTARLLFDMLSQPDPNPWLGPGRTEAFFTWYLEQAFGELDVAEAKLPDHQPQWEEGQLVVQIGYPEWVPPCRGVADPGELRWRLAGSSFGGCGRQQVLLDFGREDHLDEVIDLLKRLPAE